MNRCLVSIIIPCYNQGQYLAESIGSVLASDHDDLEIIVVDDGSTDPETVRIIKALDYPKTKLIRRQNGGLAAARNSGIAEARGRYILPLDADDRIGPQYISQAVAALEANSGLGIVYCHAEKFGAETGPWRLSQFSRWRMALGNVIFCSAIYRRDDWNEVSGYDESLQRGWEDWDFWLGLLERGRKVLCLPHVGFYYRKSPTSLAAGMSAELKLALHRRMMFEHGRFFGGWALLLEALLPVYYRLADSAVYRGIKKGMGR
jgi:glycosyltransferase involved in cell wall biosynthesis